jgi:hypothetical protein
MFSQADVDTALNYSDNIAVFGMYDRTKSGQIRFDVRNMHINELNKLLTKKIKSQADLEALKKQMRKKIKQQRADASA